MKKRLMALCLAVALVIGALGGCTKDEPVTPEPDKDGAANVVEKEPDKEKEKDQDKKEPVKEVKLKYDTLILGEDDFNAVFSPFFGSTVPDRTVYQRTHEPLLINDRLGKPVDRLAEYQLPEEIKDADGNVIKTVYTFKLKDGIKFSDGTDITADDIMFSYKVYCDPTYDGSSTIYTTPILGIAEYRYDDPNYKEAIDKIKSESENVSDEDVKNIITESVNKDIDDYGAQFIIDYFSFKVKEGLDEAGLKEAAFTAYFNQEVEKSFEDYKADAKASKFKSLEKEYISENLASGELKVPEVEGIKKIDERTVQVTIEGVDPKAIWNLAGIEIVPEAYYGVGFKKGDLSGVKAKNDAPMGAGPFRFLKFENNVASFEANEHYFLGKPKIPKLKIQVVSTANRLEAVTLGEMDIAQPTASPDMVEQVKEAGLHYELIENLGYGYIGVNADRVKDKNIRKGLLHLMNRKPAIETYYGELASIIERPMSKVSWAYPTDATEFYGFDPDKALEYFKEAGYEQVDENGTKKLMKDGRQMSYEIGIAGDGIMDHPSAPILTQMKQALEDMGGVLEINDVTGTILFERLDQGNWDMWVAAWGSTIDPDMYQVYSSQGPTNHYRIRNERLDEVIIDARKTNDVELRKELYKEALNIVMDEAVEMPVYQRKNMYIFNKDVVDILSLPKEMTPFYDWQLEMETLRTK